MTGFLEGLRAFSVVLAVLVVFFVAQTFLTPQQMGFVLITSLFIGMGFAVAQLLKRTSPTLNTRKKFRKAFFEGKPITPKHNRTKRGHWDDDNRFFEESADFVDEINHWMQRLEQPFRLQEYRIADVDLGHEGREFLIFHNQVQVGKMTLCCAEPDIYVAEVDLSLVRFMNSYTIRSFLTLLAEKVAGANNKLQYEQLIDREMVDALWDQNLVSEFNTWVDEPSAGNLSIRFEGDGWADVLERVAMYGKRYNRSSQSQ